MPTVSDRLVRARLRDFVGREEEQAILRQALEAEELPFLVMDVYGPGGVGKTALLWRFQALALELGAHCVRLDGEELEPSGASFRAALGERLGGAFPDSLPPGRRTLLLVDSFERLASLDGWMRSTFLPGMPLDVLIVRASDQPPAPGWRSDPGWSALHCRMPLRNLRPEESRAFLHRKGVPREHFDAILGFSHGHPLALTLVADLFLQNPQAEFRPESWPDIVGALLERILGQCPSPEHRLALEACATVRMLTQPLLQAMLDSGDVHGLFEWLRGLSFVQARTRGLQLHELAREALSADLRWRDRDLYRRLHDRSRKYFAARLEEATSSEHAEILFDYVFLHRDNPVVAPVFNDAAALGWEVGRVRPEEKSALEEMTRRQEGPEAAGWMGGWLDRQPESFVVVRDPDGALRGYLCTLALERLQSGAVEDPGVAAALEYLRERAPLRPGEKASMFRFWMDSQHHQAPSLVQSRIFIEILRHYLSTPGLAFTFLATSALDTWGDLFAYADTPRISEADFEGDGRSYGVFGHDWRAVPPVAWLELLATRSTAEAKPQEGPAIRPLVVLSRTAFEEAVGRALRHYDSPDLMIDNPVLGSRLVVAEVGAEAGEAERIEALRKMLREATDSLRYSRRQVKFHRALHHTYIQPAGTQEQAAELIDVPFSSYRRHLKAGMDRVAEILWHRELSAS